MQLALAHGVKYWRVRRPFSTAYGYYAESILLTMNSLFTQAFIDCAVDLLALGHEVPEDLFEEDEEAPVYKKRRLTQGQESHMNELRERLEVAKGAYKLLREQVDRAVDTARAADERVEVAKKAAGEGRDKVKRLYEGIRSICKEAEEAGQPLLE
ncbi:uncharacterized protein BO66DRAFT_48374 [Aspergillus aculeatinus CBS 121060]|uniref:Uncharacterized protein n=1 Tax=Aspergillus aculeatinus CBS 121060 TaxID=1448322 RepID=A0ACD1HEA3_9EURO|nr:hypothetical protein BO66DRAFT_48374 [Aspergillus aculeatinus CBS 121060]RAH71759.1 hypothetical protein BO66DRAFT_48374 [Aspergillus aculeatinus CBS 121060]